MGMSTHVIGFMLPNEKFNKMKELWDLCNELTISPPPEVAEFFNNDNPNPFGAEVNIDDCISEFKGEYAEGFDVDIRKLPKKVHIIRILNEY